MEIFKKVLKEIGIAFILILVIAGVAVIAFYKQIPFAKQIPESINYTSIDKTKYDVRGDVENVKNDTETYMSSAKELRYYELIKLVLPGRVYPFGSINSGTDLPSEYVNGSSVSNPSQSGSEDGSGNTGGYVDPTTGVQLPDSKLGEVDVDRLTSGT